MRGETIQAHNCLGYRGIQWFFHTSVQRARKKPQRIKGYLFILYPRDTFCNVCEERVK